MKISRLRRALAVLLSAAMLIMCMPTVGITAAAAVTDTTSCMYITVDGTVNTASEVDPDAVWSSGTLSDALAVANEMHNGKTVYIKMLSDVTGDNYGQTISFSAYNGNTVFDLNGHSVDGNNAYRCVHAKSKGTLTISSSASSRGTITNGYSESDGAAGIYHEYGTLTLSNVNVTNNTLKGRYGAGVTSLSSSTSTTLSNVKISGNQSLYRSDSFAGGFMPYKPFTLKNQVEITGNSNSFSNDRNFYPVLVVGDVSKSSISGLTAGSEIKIWNNSGKVTISGDGGNNPDIYNYFTLTNDNYWLAPTSTGGLQATNSVYAVIFDMQGKADNVVNTVSSGAKATKPSDPTASDGSTFGGWYKDKECTEEFDFTAAITQNTTVYAKWEAPARITITLDPNGGTLPEGTESTATTTDGKLATLPEPTRTDFVFDGWFDAKTGGNEVTTETKFEDNATIYAQWTYAKLDNNFSLVLDEVKKKEIVSTMIDGETFDSEDVSDLFTINDNSELLNLSAVITDKQGNPSGTYKAYQDYYAMVTISPKSGYTFEDINKVKIYFGGITWYPEVHSSENYVKLRVDLGEADYEYEDVSVDKVQVNVDTSNLTLTANEKIDDEAVYNCFSVPDDVIYSLYFDGIAYEDAEGNYVAADLENGETYAEGKKYYAKLAIALLAPETVMYNYYFADNVTITFGDGTIPFDVSRRTGACIEGYYPIGTVSTAEPPENEEGDIIVDNSDNYSGAGVADAEEAKSVIPVTDDEKAAIENGENLYIILDVMDGTNTVPTTDRTAVNTIANENGLKVGMILDIELFKRIGENGRDVRITETNGMLTVEFTMPAELLSTDSTVTRTYKIIRVHNGVTDILDCTFDPATGKASFKTDKFSTYAIAYVDVRAAQPQTPAVQYPLDLGTDGRVHSNATTAAAGDKITITVDPGYIAHIISGGREIAKITGTGTFIMPANGIKVVVECELGGLMLTNARSYVYSYDSDMNKIAVSATKKQKNTVTINLGKDYAGKSFVIYEGKKSTSVKVTEGTLDKNGKFTFEVDYGKNYTLVVED